MLETIVHKYRFNFFLDNNVLTAFELDFVPGYSTIKQLIYIYKTFCKALDEGKEVRYVFCDITKNIKVFFFNLILQGYLDRF